MKRNSVREIDTGTSAAEVPGGASGEMVGYGGSQPAVL